MSRRRFVEIETLLGGLEKTIPPGRRVVVKVDSRVLVELIRATRSLLACLRSAYRIGDRPAETAFGGFREAIISPRYRRWRKAAAARFCRELDT